MDDYNTLCTLRAVFLFHMTLNLVFTIIIIKLA